MEMEVVITCESCRHRNRQDLGMPGFEVLQTEFVFSDAWQHQFEHRDHYMEITIRPVEGGK
jgi:hypothetical protein